MNIQEKALKEFIIKFIRIKYNPENPNAVLSDWGFGHDWNKSLPVECKDTADAIVQGVYTSLCVLFTYKPLFNKEGVDFRIEELVCWLSEKELKTPPHSVYKALIYGSWNIYYFLKLI